MRGLVFGVFLLAGIALYTARGRSIVGSRWEPDRLPLSIRSVEPTLRDGGGFLNVTVRNQELYSLRASVACDPGEDGGLSPCSEVTIPVLSPGEEARVRLGLTAASIGRDAITVVAREAIQYVGGSERLSPACRLRVDLR